MNIDLEKLRFPIGRYKHPESFDMRVFNNSINTISELPAKLRNAVSGLSEDQLATKYRENGWTLRQVVHHIADSHMNAYIRMKLAVTEDNPTIKPYDQKAWAKLSDGSTAPIEISLNMIDALHARWVYFLNSLQEEDFQKTFYHPESDQNQPISLWLTIYAWHGDHHLAHITNTKARKGWS